MTTALTKPVMRATQTTVRDRSKRRLLIAGLLPGDVFVVRLKGTRQSVEVPIESVYLMGMKKRAAQLVAERLAKRKAKRRGAP